MTDRPPATAEPTECVLLDGECILSLCPNCDPDPPATAGQPSTEAAWPVCPRCWHGHLDYDDEACVSCGCPAWERGPANVYREAHVTPPSLDREPNPEAVKRISAHLWGEDIVNVKAALESFPNGWTVTIGLKEQTNE